MKKRIIPILALVFLAFLPAGSCGNPGPKPVPTNVDAGPNPVVEECSGYCDHLKSLPCSEGTNPKCQALCERVLQENLIKLPVTCVMSATTVAAAVKCGAECKE
jgi:hypothetical protein